MKIAFESTVKQKIRDGEWEAITDRTRSNIQEMRSNITGKRFLVQIVKGKGKDYENVA